jgi:methionyl-tRNA formyltransferase
MEPATRIAYAVGDRELAVRVFSFLLDEGVLPEALLVPARDGAHVPAIIRSCGYLAEDRILEGKSYASDEGLDLLRSLDLDYVVCVRFPYIVPPPVLEIPRVGVTNMHPALLPANRGWHTPTWAILDRTPYGGTLHFMTAGLDEGDVIHQKELQVLPSDTADSLYRRVQALELEIFREAWPWLASGSPPRTPQDEARATFHRSKDLFTPEVQGIDLDERVRAGDLLDRLRALTTNRIDEAAYFEADGTRYRVQVRIEPEPGEP